MRPITIAVDSVRRRAETILDDLVDNGPSTSAECCERVGVSYSQFQAAVKYARENLCLELGISLPAPIPGDGWLYHATTEWETIEGSAEFSMGQVERRLSRIYADVQVVLPLMDKGTVPWRRARFLEKHIDHILRTLEEING